MHPPEFAAALAVLQIDLDAEARWSLAEGRRPPVPPGLPAALRIALREARASAMARAVRAADEALWAAARRCSAGREWWVGWQRLERELTHEERAAVCVVGKRGRTLCQAWGQAKRRAAARAAANSGRDPAGR